MKNFGLKSVRIYLIGLLIFAALIALPQPRIASAASLMGGTNIATTLIDSGRFNTLVAVLEAAELTDTLGGPGTFTLFAPTDAAFAALPTETLESLLADPTGALKDLLLYHVLPGKVTSGALVDGSGGSFAMANGLTAIVRLENGRLKINDANFVAFDIEATNGIIHIIDKVITPIPSTATTVAAPSEDATVESSTAQSTEAPTTPEIMGVAEEEKSDTLPATVEVTEQGEVAVTVEATDLAENATLEVIPGELTLETTTSAVSLNAIPLDHACTLCHYVRPGDTLAKIARHYRVDIRDLVQINQLQNPNLIYIGQQLCISGN